MINWINIYFFFITLNLTGFHPVHVSVANIEYNKEAKKIELSIKLFEDDFKLLFFHLNQVEIDLKSESNYLNHKELINQYFDSHFKLLINNSDSLNLEIKNRKINDGAIWFNFEVPVQNEINSIKITNLLLLDLYYDQKNLVILKAPEKELGYQFDYKTTEKMIFINE